MTSPDSEVFAALTRVFSRLGVRWYVFGAQAAILYGVARLTEDIDVTVELGPVSTAQLVAAMEAEGFALRVDDADDFVERTRVLPMAHSGAAMPVDVVLAGPGLEALFLERVTVKLVDGLPIPIPCAEDLIVMKVLAGRPKDIEDAVGVLASCGDSVDVGMIRETLAKLERALDQSDLQPMFSQLLARARR